MKIKDGIILSQADDSYYLIDSSDSNDRFNGMLKLNKSGAEISRLLMVETTRESVIDAIVKKYDIANDVAEKNVQKVIDALTEINLIS